MKVKKLALLLGVAALGLTGCKNSGDKIADFNWYLAQSGDPAQPGNGSAGGSDTQSAVNAAINKDVAFHLSGGELFKGLVNELGGTGDALEYEPIKVTVLQNVKVAGNSYDCKIVWSYDSNNPAFKEFHYLYGDTTHAMFEFNYPSFGEADRTIEIKAYAEVGGARSAEVSYPITLKAPTNRYDDHSISDIYNLNAAGNNFAFVDDADWMVTNYNQSYWYVGLAGKITYVSPDGNWGLLSDGDQTIEIYAGSGTKINVDNYFGLRKKYVRVYGDLAVYHGNLQLGFISKIVPLSNEEKAKIVEPSSWIDYAAKVNEVHQYTRGMMNGFAQLTNATFLGNFKDSNDKTTTLDAIKAGKNARFTFEVSAGGKTIVIANDYHTNVNALYGDGGLFDSYLKTLESKTAGSSTISIKGTLRFVSTSGNFKDIGAFQLVPFYNGQIA